MLWRKLPGARSAGRVQSVALRLVCDREAEIEAFRTEEYWTIEAAARDRPRARSSAPASTPSTARRSRSSTSRTRRRANAIKAAIEKGEFTRRLGREEGGEAQPVRAVHHLDAADGRLAQARLLGQADHAGRPAPLRRRRHRRRDRRPHHLHANRRRHDRAGGDQRHPRPDRARVFASATSPPFIREYKTKAKNAQEAHEAIRPTDVAPQARRTSPSYLETDQARLYELIWKRAVASQMASAELEQTTADIEVQGPRRQDLQLRATGSVVQFDGFLKVYEEGRDERLHAARARTTSPRTTTTSRRLPPLAQGDKRHRPRRSRPSSTSPSRRRAFPKRRWSSSMEELGIGRPSTYASTLAVLQERDYVRIDKKRLIPEDKGRLVTAFLESFFKRYVEYDFTADLEEKLDLISDGKLDWKDVLRDFWRDFTGAVDDIKDLRVGEVLEALNEILGPHIFPPREDGGDPRSCPTCRPGRLSLKISASTAPSSAAPTIPSAATRASSPMPATATARPRRPTASCSATTPTRGLAVTLRTGRFGPYVQLGEGTEDEKPKRVEPAERRRRGDRSISSTRCSCCRCRARSALHPETGKPITAGLGRYGPFILHDGTYANLDGIEEVFSVGLNRAVALLAEKAAGGGKSRFQRASRRCSRTWASIPTAAARSRCCRAAMAPT